MRTTSEVLEVILDNLEFIGLGSYECGGLCALSSHLCNVGAIPVSGYFKARRYISDYAPNSGDFGNYRWPKGEREPREKWLKKHIDILKEKGE